MTTDWTEIETDHDANNDAFDALLTDEWFEGVELAELLLAPDDDGDTSE